MAGKTGKGFWLAHQFQEWEGNILLPTSSVVDISTPQVPIEIYNMFLLESQITSYNQKKEMALSMQHGSLRKSVGTCRVIRPVRLHPQGIKPRLYLVLILGPIDSRS